MNEVIFSVGVTPISKQAVRSGTHGRVRYRRLRQWVRLPIED